MPPEGQEGRTAGDVVIDSVSAALWNKVHDAIESFPGDEEARGLIAGKLVAWLTDYQIEKEDA